MTEHNDMMELSVGAMIRPNGLALLAVEVSDLASV